MNKKMPIVETLQKYKKNKGYGFHIPGHHQGNAIGADFRALVGYDALSCDITDEFNGVGTLHPSSGVIDEAQKLAAEAFGARRTFFITCGSTVANLAIAFGATKPNDEILIGRNCHRSVLTGAIISGANPLWLIPRKLENWAIFANVCAHEVENTLKNNKNIKFVWLTNPTYEGVVSDIRAISNICRKYNVPLAVDEAHGSLWNFSDKLPKSALEYGADIVVNSIHKTGGSMVQTSMMHISKNSKIDDEKIEHALKLLHTTSPSVLLLASLDSAREYLKSDDGKCAITKAIDNAKFLRDSLKNIPDISILNEHSNVKIDVTKVFIKVEGLSGLSLEHILERDFNIEVESASDVGVLILSNIGNSREDFEYLIFALKKIASAKRPDTYDEFKIMPLVDPKILMSPRDAYFAPKEMVNKYDAVGRICTEVIAMCPPGISILLPGELIRKEHLPYLADRQTVEVLKVR